MPGLDLVQSLPGRAERQSNKLYCWTKNCLSAKRTGTKRNDSVSKLIYFHILKLNCNYFKVEKFFCNLQLVYIYLKHVFQNQHGRNWLFRIRSGLKKSGRKWKLVRSWNIISIYILLFKDNGLPFHVSL